MIFVVQGYLPGGFRVEELKDLLRKEYQDQVTVQIVEIDQHQADKVPVILKNHSLIKPFELLLSIFSPAPVWHSGSHTLYSFFLSVIFWVHSRRCRLWDFNADRFNPGNVQA